MSPRAFVQKSFTTLAKHFQFSAILVVEKTDLVKSIDGFSGNLTCCFIGFVEILYGRLQKWSDNSNSNDFNT
jgi:hypothetical protein